MITNYWLEKGISALLLLLVVILGYLSFGYPLYFDQLTLFVLVGSLALYKLDQNLASIAFIILLVRILNEVLFAYEGVYQDFLFYLGSFLFAYKFKFDSQVKRVLIPLLTACCLAHIYWYFIEYEGPHLGIYVLAVALNCLLRYLLMFRAHLTTKLPYLNLSGITLDYDIYRLASFSNILISLMVIEYLIRHLTPLNPLIVYETYSYALQVILLFIPYFFLSYFVKSKFRLYA